VDGRGRVERVGAWVSADELTAGWGGRAMRDRVAALAVVGRTEQGGRTGVVPESRLERGE
jgi:hypothetical protein